MADFDGTTVPEESKPPGKTKRSQAVQFFLRGLAISLPSILTLVILLWVAGGVYDFIIEPITKAVRFTMAQAVERTLPTNHEELVRPYERPPIEFCGREYVIRRAFQERFHAKRREFLQDDREPARSGQPSVDTPAERLANWLEAEENNEIVYVPMGKRAVPYGDYVEVASRLSPAEMPASANGLYMELVTTRYFKSLFNLSAVAILIAIVLLYFLGRVVTARIGAWVVHKVEKGVLARVPLVSNVYSSVKQVTDFLFTERTVEYSRVVAVEYPRRGIWSLALVTGDSMLEVTSAAGEPMVSILIPSSPIPVTGYTMSVPRREVIDMNLTIDQAFQFCVSCGVLVPAHQKVTPESLQQELSKRLAGVRPPISQSEYKLAIEETGEHTLDDGQRSREKPS